LESPPVTGKLRAELLLEGYGKARQHQESCFVAMRLFWSRCSVPPLCNVRALFVTTQQKRIMRAKERDAENLSRARKQMTPAISLKPA
jgi:hypothetical protein